MRYPKVDIRKPVLTAVSSHESVFPHPFAPKFLCCVRLSLNKQKVSKIMITKSCVRTTICQKGKQYVSTDWCSSHLRWDLTVEVLTPLHEIFVSKRSFENYVAQCYQQLRWHDEFQSSEKGTFFENVYNRLNVEKMITDEMLLVFAEIQKTVAFLASIK